MISLRRTISSIFLVCTILLDSCSHPLSVQTQYFSHEDLASFHIGTPDPRLYYPAIGQRLFIQWSLPPWQFEPSYLTLYLKIRFHNHQEHEIQVPIEKKCGYYLYELCNKEYQETGGILTYLVEIRKGDCVLASWKHPLWVPLITFEKPIK